MSTVAAPPAALPQMRLSRLVLRAAAAFFSPWKVLTRGWAALAVPSYR